jgi:perosamine synthetase
LFLIHYIGFPQKMEAIDAWRKKRGLVLVEDCALALLSESHGRSVGTFGDYAVFCLYKTLPLPNGGMLVENGRALPGLRPPRMRPVTAASAAGRTLELLLESFRARHPRLGRALFAGKRGVGRAMDAVRWRRVPVGDSGFDAAGADLDMSSFCHRLLRRFDYAHVRQRRRENFELLAQRLAGRANPLRAALDNGTCPLFFPILVRDKARAARALWDRGIGAVELWNEGDPECAGGRYPETDYLRRHVLELPLHQSVSRAQIEYMADEVGRLDIHL